MNKSERYTLARIVSNMIHGFESDLSVIDKGREILQNFPSIQEECDKLRVQVAENNVIYVIMISLYKAWDPLFLDQKIQSLYNKTACDISEILHYYLFSLESNWDKSVLEIESRLASASNDDNKIWEIILSILQSEKWIEYTSYLYTPGSQKYNYLCFHQD